MTDDSFLILREYRVLLYIFYIYNNNLLILFLFLKLSSVICHGHIIVLFTYL